MINMSYCRFYNTNLALIECLDALNDERSLSEDEFNACKRLFENFIDFCCDDGIVVDEGGELDERLQEFFDEFEIDN